MHKLCYMACFNCVRTRLTLSLPAPVRYADLCAYRAKVHIEAQRELAILNREEHALEIEDKIVEKLKEWVILHHDTYTRMYYC